MSETTKAKRKSLSWAFTTVIFINVGFALLISAAFVWFGSLTASLAYLGGDRLVADAYSKSFGSMETGENRRVAFNLTNMSNHPITIIGARSSCTCTMPQDLPLTIQPAERRSITISVSPRTKSGRVFEKLNFFTDDASQPELLLAVEGSVVGSNNKKE